MYKQHLLNSIEKEINICRRLYTKIPPGQINFRPKEGIRSTLELLQYLGCIGSLMLTYWLKKEETDFRTFYGSKMDVSKTMPPEQFVTVMDEQLVSIRNLFDQVSEEDLFQKEITYPWSGSKDSLGEGIIASSVKWLAAYKLQLFLFIKLSSEQELTTADAWVLTELPL
ncbi:MAG: hypothetical protein ABI707_04175 [Ferruginibacter sp.]